MDAAVLAKYDPDQPRDPDGRWGSGGGSSGAADHAAEASRLNREISDLDHRIRSANEFDRFDLNLQRDALTAQRDYHAAQANVSSTRSPAGGAKEITTEDLRTRSAALKMTPAERNAVISYTSGDYAVINGDLRKQDMSRLSDSLKSNVQTLDALAERGRLPEAAVTYRGVHNDALSKLKPGDTIVDHAFVSTSADPAVVSDRFNERYVMHITSPAGTKAIPNPSSEKELVLGRGVAMRLDRKEDRTVNGRPQTILHMTVVGQR